MPDNSTPNRRSSFALLIALGVLAVAALVFFRRGNSDGPLPLPPPDRYREMVTAFYTGTIALIVQDPDRPEANLKRATEIIPEEPAGWANLGLMYLRRPKQMQEAKTYLEKAKSLAPQSGEIEALLGHLENQQGRISEALAHFRRAVELAPNNLFARYALAELIQRQRDPDYQTDYQRQLEGILAVQPRNIKALLELADIASERKDEEALQRAVAGLEAESKEWPPQAQQAMQRLKDSAGSADPFSAKSRILGLNHLISREPAYQRSFHVLKPADNAVGVPLERFLRLPTPSPLAAPPDTALTFSEEAMEGANGERSALALFFTLTPEINKPLADSFGLEIRPEGASALVLTNGRAVRITTNGKTSTLSFPGGSGTEAPSPDSLAAVDLDYDFGMDLVMAGMGGLRLYVQDANRSFRDVTVRAGLPPSILNAPCYGVWTADIDLDGDLDLVVGQHTGSAQILRNNGDGAFTPQNHFEAVKGLRGFVWADVDGDGDPDAALLDSQGKVHIFINERSGRFVVRPLPPEVGAVAAISAGDVNRDGLIDFVLLQADGSIRRLSDKSDGSAWDTATVAQWQDFDAKTEPGSARLFLADLDNNGGLDLIASTPKSGQAWLSDTNGEFQPLAASTGGGIFAVADRNGDGKLDLLALNGEGKPVSKTNQSAKNYGWVEVRPRATRVTRGLTGDSRINSFGVGGEMEARSGLLVQKQVILGPTVHFGLGDNQKADYTRIVWPNGAVQGEFDLKSAEPLVTIQRLKGSCPWLFAWNGEKMEFVTDFIWRSPLGLKINAQDTAGVMATEDWVKIRGDQLVPKDGFYDLRITAELWETHFFDYLSLMVVDHPVGTEIFIDERFAMPPPDFKVYTVAPPQPIVRAIDDNGDDVTATVRDRDGQYLDTFGRGQYQGVTRDHTVEIELPREAASRKPVYLIANGWIHPTDSSINVAISQGRHAPPKSLQLEIPDGKGGWKTARRNLGFPSGKTKTILIDLTGVFDTTPGRNPASDLRLRLRTNLEIYWDQITWAAGRPDTAIKTRRLMPNVADLRFRGFSATNQASASAPELPDYDIIQTRAQKWRDLIGFHTRFGDVRELLQKVDDRYVIMNAGDEMALLFPELPPPPSGWVRDYVLIGDGWEKDGDYNTTFSKTVLPLPSHDQPNYNIPPGRLEDDPVYRRHPRDWQTYHTRYVTPEAFRNALRPRLLD